MYAGFGSYAGIGFGLDVPMTKFGTQAAVGHPAADNSGTCSDSFAVQQMLKDLGYYTSTIDGQLGNNSFKALKAFSADAGVPYSGSFPKSDTCQALIDAWKSSKGLLDLPPPPSAPAPKPVSSPLAAPKLTVVAAPGRSASLATAPAKSVGAWWSALPAIDKVAVVGGGVLLVGGIFYLATKPKKATPNRRRRSSKRRKKRYAR